MPTPEMSPKEHEAYDNALRMILAGPSPIKRKGLFLDLSRLGLTKLPPEVGRLSDLEALNISGNLLVSLPEEIAQLTKLSSLDASNNRLTALPLGFGKLKSLSVLDLGSNRLDTFPPELTALESLSELHIEHNKIKELPPAIGQLSSLKTLDVSYNVLEVISPELSNLKLLSEFSAQNNLLSDIPTEFSELNSLLRLDIGNNRFTSFPLATTHLPALEDLCLASNKFDDVPSEISRLLSLTSLSLANNPISRLPVELSLCQKLRNLVLGQTRFEIFPREVRELKALTFLSIENTPIQSLPEWVGEFGELRDLIISQGCQLITRYSGRRSSWQNTSKKQHEGLVALPNSLKRYTKLKTLILHGNDRLGIPQEILGDTWHDLRGTRAALNPRPSAERILNFYFAQRGVDARPLNEVKLLLVGRGGAGKTSVVERLVKGTFKKTQESTTGIALQDWTLPCLGGDPVTVHMWDFAGQVIAHATHQFFLSARSVYLLVLTAREDSQREDAEYWLRLIRAFGTEDGKTSKVLVVLNKWAASPVRLDREALREKYPFIIGYIETDCESGLGIPELKSKLAEIIGTDEAVREKTGKAYFDVKEALRKRWDEQKTNHLEYAEFEKLCEAAQVTDKGQQKSMAANLHRLGLALNYGDDLRLRDTTVLNPHWVTDGIYVLLRQAPNERAELSLEAACRTLPKEAAGKVMFLIRLMQKYDLAFPLKEDEQMWLVPAALADSQPALGTEWQGEATRLRWTYAALPEGLVPRFITRTHSLSEGQPRWLNGTILELGAARAVVRADAPDRRISATVIGPEPARQHLTGTIQTEMRSLNAEIKGLNPLEELQLSRAPEVWASVEGLENTEKRAAEKNREPVVEMLTPQGPLEVNATEENNRITAEDARTDAWKPRVFISYSHKDDAAKDQLVLKLKVLQAAGLVDYWLDVDLAAGEEWNRGITEELERMDVFVLLVSDHSLTSDYINRVEIKRALERRNQGAAEVVPIILHRCQWTVCGMLNHLVAIPKDGKPVTDHKPHAIGWHDVSERLMKLFEKLKQQHTGERRSDERQGDHEI